MLPKSMPSLEILASACLAAFLLAVTLVDARTQRIPDLLNLAMGVSGLGFALALRQPALDHLIGIAVGYGAIFLINAAYRYFRERDGIGMGDAKFLAASGAWLGWFPLPFVALIAAGAALAYLALAALWGRPVRGDTRVAFGPFLAFGVAAAWVTLIFRASPSAL